MKINRTLNSKDHMKLSNQSLVYEAFDEGEKLTIAEATAKVNSQVDLARQMSEQTVRRAIHGLVGLGHLKPFGRAGLAMTYGKLSTEMTAGNGEQELIPFAGSMETVETFLQIMTDPNGQPFKLKVPIMSEEISHAVRRTLVYVVLSSSEVGNTEALKVANRRLNNLVAELEYILGNLTAFVDSPVWYEQYRDQMGYALRRLQEKNPDLFKLAMDYKNGG